MISTCAGANYAIKTAWVRLAHSQHDARRALPASATGQQGGWVARMLLERGHRVRALTRNPRSAKAQELARMGATLFQGEMEDRVAIGRAVEGADALFLLSTLFEVGWHTFEVWAREQDLNRYLLAVEA